MSDITPLTPAEMDVLERGPTYGAPLLTENEKRLLATVRDRERQRDKAVQEINRLVEQDIRNLREERDELQRQLAEFKHGNAYSKLGGQLAEVSQERHRLERELAEAQKDTERLMDTLVDLLELVESNAPDGYYIENRRITRARETVQQATDAARE